VLDSVSLFAELKRRNVFRVAIAYGVIAWVLAQVADLAFDNFGSPEWVSKTVLFLLMLGLPLAVFFAWAFELTPEGIKKEKDVDRTESITPKTGRKLDLIIIAVLVIAVSLLLADRFRPGEEAEPFELVETDSSKMSIAVLPFDNRSNRDEDVYFTEGIHDDLLTTMANIGSMKVISRTSVMEYKDTTKKIPEIARELGVANILEGGIQRSGNQVRINVQLIDAETDEHLWAEIYDRELTAENLFVIQSEVSKAIANALHATLSPEEHERISAVPTQNLEAYETYLLGRQRWTARTAESTAESVMLFQKAIDLDPNFAQAWAGLADAYRHQVPYGGVPAAEAFSKAEVAVRKALELDDQLGEAHATLGGLLRQMGDLPGGEAALWRALELNPNYAPAYNWLGVGFNSEGKLEKGLEMYQKGLELDPLSPVLLSNAAANAGGLGRFDEMQARYERVIELNPNSPFGYTGMADYHASVRGRFDQSLSWRVRALEQDPTDIGNLTTMSYNYLNLGDYQAAKYWTDQASEVRSDNIDINLALFALALRQGDMEAANTHARRAAELSTGQSFLPFVLMHLMVEDLASGNGDNALARYHQEVPTLFQNNGYTVTASNFPMGLQLAYLLRETGLPDQANKLLADVQLVMDSMPVLGYWGSGPFEAIAYAMSGEDQTALAALRVAVDAGWRWGWWYFFDHDPLLESLRGYPEFQAMRAEIAADMAEQLKNVRRMEANEEIPAPAWPAPKNAAPPPT